MRCCPELFFCMRILRRYTVRFRGGKTRFVGRVLALHGGFHAAQAGFQCADSVAEHIGQRLLVQVVRRAGLAATHADHFGRNTDRGGIGKQILSTTLPAPTRTLSPIYTGPSTLAPAPISTLLPNVGWRLPESLPVPPRVTPW